MSISVQQAQGRVPVAIVCIEGALDASNYQDLIATAREVYAAGTRHILLDMTHTSFMSSSGIVALHSIALLLRGQPAPDPESGWAALHSVRDTRDAGMQQYLKLLNPQPQVQQVLDKVGLAGLFDSHTDLATAVASF